MMEMAAKLSTELPERESRTLGAPTLCIRLCCGVNTIRGGTGFQVEGGTPNNSAGKKSNDSRSIYWYHTTSALYQSNESGVEYYVIAIG